MCGIVGFISPSLHEDDLLKMTNALSHRGPDSSGVYKCENVGLGHRRLSIIDLSPTGHQPMISRCERFVMVYNGEVYNYRELANKYDLNLIGSSDSEVVLELFALRGVDAISELKGIFAVAIYDKLDKCLVLFRDRLGIKPLYYYHNDATFAFSSEIKALEKVDNISRHITVSKSAIKCFLHLGFIPEPDSIYSQIKKLEPGQYITIDSTGIRSENFWQIEDAFERDYLYNSNEDLCAKKLKELLEASIEAQMVSDVPVGTFLSGGIDSSLVSAIASKYSGKKLKTFSIGFDDKSLDESIYAAQIADYLKTDHHELIISPDDLIEQLPNIINFYDEPFGDASAIPMLAISSFASQHVKTVLSGDGGDELFHGYHRYKWVKFLNRKSIKILRPIIYEALKYTRYRPLSTKRNLFARIPQHEYYSHFFSQQALHFSISEINALMPGVDDNPDLRIPEVNARTLKHVEEATLFDLKYYLRGDNLVKVDRASMAKSLEVRVPLLDEDILDFALNINPGLKMKSGKQKFLLKEVLKEYIPESMFDRPKQGFSIPLAKWLQSDLNYLIHEYLSNDAIKRTNILNTREVDNIRYSFNKGNKALATKIWLMIILQKFLLTKVYL